MRYIIQHYSGTIKRTAPDCLTLETEGDLKEDRSGSKDVGTEFSRRAVLLGRVYM